MFSSKKIIWFIFACIALSAHSQIFRLNNRMFNSQGGITRAEIKLVPNPAVMGQQCAFVLEFEIPKNNIIEELRVLGMPETDDNAIEYLADGFENLVDGTTTNKNNIVKRFRLPVIFHKTHADVIDVTVSGNVGTRTERAGMSMSSFRGFQKSLPSLKVDVRSLPEENKPSDFFGAVGNAFSINTKLQPSKVHPGDLVTATYEIKYDGYFPTNAAPIITGLSERDFTIYELKRQQSGDGIIAWTQILVPKNATATNSLTVKVPFYNPEKEVYEEAIAHQKPLEFISTEAASTENTSVIVSDSKDDKSVKIQSGEILSLQIRFAPNEKSPIIATVPSTTPIKELSKYGKWIRISTPEAIGWIKNTTFPVPQH